MREDVGTAIRKPRANVRKCLLRTVVCDVGMERGSRRWMIAESGICLARDVPHDAVGGGFWTTASAMGEPLIVTLENDLQ
jgi:hypothetical protein